MTAPARAPAAASAAVWQPAGPRSPARRTWVQMVMGLPVSVTLRGPGARSDRAEQVVQAVYADLRSADRAFSTYRPGSEIIKCVSK